MMLLPEWVSIFALHGQVSGEPAIEDIFVSSREIICPVTLSSEKEARAPPLRCF
jgi:hypothetical protein